MSERLRTIPQDEVAVSPSPTRAPRYQAFISYAAADAEWARWLHRALERYRVPRELVGHRARFGPIGKGLAPIFRDREDLEAHGDLSGRLQEALEESKCLIVICSPESARSRWVASEIEHFVSLGRRDRILALIVGGEATARDERGAFPEALWRSRTGDSVSPLPLAADARPEHDGKPNARLKIIAGLLGISLTDLTRREIVAERRRRRFSQLIAALLAFLALGALTAAGVASWQRSLAMQEEQRANENLDIAVGSLERVVFGISRSLHNIEGVSQSSLRTILRTMVGEIEAASQQSPGDPRMAELRVALLSELAEISVAQGDAEALDFVTEKLDELVAHSGSSVPDSVASAATASRGAALFYRGRAAEIRGETEEAAAFFRQVVDHPPQTQDPDVDLNLRTASLTHLGDLAMQANRLDEAKASYEEAIGLLDKVEIFEDPAAGRARSWRLDRDWRLLREHGLLRERLGKAASSMGDFATALQLYAASAEVAEILGTAFPEDTTIQLDLAFVQALRGRALLGQGETDAGVGALEEAVDTFRRINDLSPGRLDVLDPYVKVLEDLAAQSGDDADASLTYLREAIDGYRSLLVLKADDDWRDRLVEHSVHVSRRLGERSDDSAALQYLRSARRFLSETSASPPRALDFRWMARLHGELAKHGWRMGDKISALHEAGLAVDAAKKAYALDDGSAEEMAVQMRAYADLLALEGRAEEARNVLARAKTVGPQVAEGGSTEEEKIEQGSRLAREAFVRFHGGDLDAAIILLKQALAQLPNDLPRVDVVEKRLYWHDALGGFHLMKQDRARAKSAFESAFQAAARRLEMGDSDTKVLSYHSALMGKIAWVEVQDGRRDAALDWFRQAVAAARRQARIFPSETSTQRAIAIYERALEDLTERWPESKSEIPLVMP